jgi:hypothetical protein
MTTRQYIVGGSLPFFVNETVEGEAQVFTTFVNDTTQAVATGTLAATEGADTAAMVATVSDPETVQAGGWIVRHRGSYDRREIDRIVEDLRRRRKREQSQSVKRALRQAEQAVAEAAETIEEAVEATEEPIALGEAMAGLHDLLGALDEARTARELIALAKQVEARAAEIAEEIEEEESLFLILMAMH